MIYVFKYIMYVQMILNYVFKDPRDCQVKSFF